MTMLFDRQTLKNIPLPTPSCAQTSCSVRQLPGVPGQTHATWRVPDRNYFLAATTQSLRATHMRKPLAAFYIESSLRMRRVCRM
jgi:hypothetical protein